MACIAPQVLALFLATADDGPETELRLSLVAEHLELEGAAFAEWLETHMAPVTLVEATDFALIQLYQTFEDHKAFAELIRRYDTYMRNLIFGYVHDQDAVDEVAQEFGISMMGALYRFEFNSKYRTYAHRVAVNEALMFLRSRRRSKMDQDEIALDAAPADHPPVHDHLLYKRIHTAVAQLPDKLRAPFTLRHIQGMNCKDAAENLGIPVGLLRQRVHRACLCLREHLQKTVMLSGTSS